MNRVRASVLAAAIAGSMVVGGAIGAVLYGVTTISAAAATSPTPTPAATTIPRSNEAATHEAGETAAQESTENTSGPGGPGGAFKPNETAAHEATESAAREAQENAGQRPTVP